MGLSLEINCFDKEVFHKALSDNVKIPISGPTPQFPYVEVKCFEKHYDLLYCFTTVVQGNSEYEHNLFSAKQLAEIIAKVKNGTDWLVPEHQEQDLDTLIDILNDTDFSKQVLTFTFDV